MKTENIKIELIKEQGNENNRIFIYDKTNLTTTNHLHIHLPPLPHTKKQIEHFNTYTVEILKFNIKHIIERLEDWTQVTLEDYKIIYGFIINHLYQEYKK